MIKLRMPDNYIGLSRGYYTTGNAPHLGIDFGWNGNYGGQNTTLYSPADGTVTTVVDGYGNTYPGSRVYGNYIVVNHGGGVETLLGHVLKGSFKVKRGDRVTMGQALCQMNNSGYSNGSHLHFEVRINGNKVDPLLYTYVYPDQTVSPNTACKSQIQYYNQSPTAKVGTPVQRDTGRLQLKVNTDTLWGRKRPELNDDVKLGYVNPGIYNIVGTKDMTQESSNGYLWYEAEPGLWFASGDWIETLAPESNDEADWQLVYATAGKHV